MCLGPDRHLSFHYSNCLDRLTYSLIYSKKFEDIPAIPPRLFIVTFLGHFIRIFDAGFSFSLLGISLIVL